MLTEQQKVDCRRHTGYGMLGSGALMLQYWRYYRHFNTLEYRLDNLQPEEENIIVNKYLPALNQLEMSPAMVGDRSAENDNLDTKRAAVWFWNENEVQDRAGLYEYYRKLLANFLQLPIGPYGATSGGVRFVV